MTKISDLVEQFTFFILFKIKGRFHTVQLPGFCSLVLLRWPKLLQALWNHFFAHGACEIKFFIFKHPT